jgi:methionyl-tRNA formyltransferase
MTLRIVMMGTSGFAVPALHEIARGPHTVVAVYTQPPRPAGRGQKARKSAVHLAAEGLHLPVRTPASLRDSGVQDEFRELAPDLAVVGAYGLMLPGPVLDAPRFGCINLHASILPRWRGAAPIQRAILAGDEVSGISIFQMETGLDTGPVYATRELPIGPRTTAGELHDELAVQAAAMLPEVIAGIIDGSLTPRPQAAEGVTYAAKISKAEARLDFGGAAGDLERQVRAFNPWPGSFCMFENERISVLEAEPVTARGEPGTVIELPLTIACGQDALRILRGQRAGRRPMGAEELQRGLRLQRGQRLD